MDENSQTMPPQYADGSRVLCADGQTLGELVATYREYLIVERGYFFPTNFYVPYAAIAEAGGGDIVLSLNGQDALAQGWHTPPADPIAPETRAPVAPPVEPVATTAAPLVPAEAAPISEPIVAEAVRPTPKTEPVVTTTEEPTVAAVGEPGVSTETKAEQAVQRAESEPVSPENASVKVDTTTTAAPAVAVEEIAAAEQAVEVQSIQPDASVPPPAEPAEAGTVSLAPTFVGIPGRRLTDAELWSLLEPKDTPADSEEQPEDAEDKKNAPDKPDS